MERIRKIEKDVVRKRERYFKKERKKDVVRKRE